MKNSITATIEFYFKGECFTPSITIDLDLHMQSDGCLPNLHSMIANNNNIDLYSYEYEIMLAEKISITDAQGLIKEYVVKGVLNSEAFESAWQDHKALQEIQSIVKQNMGIDDLQQHPEFKKTLLEVYKTGKKYPGTRIHNKWNF